MWVVGWLKFFTHINRPLLSVFKKSVDFVSRSLEEWPWSSAVFLVALVMRVEEGEKQHNKWWGLDGLIGMVPMLSTPSCLHCIMNSCFRFLAFDSAPQGLIGFDRNISSSVHFSWTLAIGQLLPLIRFKSAPPSASAFCGLRKSAEVPKDRAHFGSTGHSSRPKGVQSQLHIFC